jgi:hypothetical protein
VATGSLTPDPGSVRERLVPDEGSVKPLTPDPGSIKAQPDQGGVDFDYSRKHPMEHGAYSFDQIKKLWTDAGGDPKYADIMAHVAYAESTWSPSSNADHKTSYVENGKTYYPEGLWQISTVHGYKESMFDPLANARRAVELFKAQGFEPWEASRHGGAGGGWGQYAGQHFDPGESTMKKQPWPKALPPGGMPAVLHSTFPKPVTQQLYEGFLSDVADQFESAIKKVSDFGWKEVQTTRMGQSMLDRTDPLLAGFGLGGNRPAPLKRLSEAVQGRLSPVLRQVGEAGDAATLSAVNVGLRALAGDKSAWPIYNQNYASLGDMLDTVGKSFMANSPDEIAYWGRQPGLLERLTEADPKTPGGLLTKIALGMHADLARLKPGHPYLTGLETGGLEFLNPSWWAAGGVGGGLTRGAMETLQAARGGAQGARVAAIAKALSDAPLLGNRFVGMGDASGIAGEYWHSKLARNMSGIHNEATDSFTSADTFGGLNQQQQTDIVHLIEHPEGQVDQMGLPIERDQRYVRIAQKKVGGLTMQERADNVIARVKKSEADLKTVAPLQAKKLITGEYAPHDGAWKTQYDSGPNAQRGGGLGSPVESGRVVPTLQEGLDRGLQMNDDWIASAAFNLHEAKMRQFITWMAGARELEHLPMTDASGTMHSFDIDYTAPMDTQKFDEAVRSGSPYIGTLQSLGRGAAGLKKLEEAATKYANETALRQAAERGLDETWLPKLAANAKSAYIARVRKLFTDKYPKHYFDADKLLGASDLAGKAISRAGVEALIDVHPGLNKLWSSRAKDFETWQRENPVDTSAESEHDKAPEPESVSVRVLDFMNHAVRFGQVLGAGYHGIFNLAPNAATRLGFTRWHWLAKALGFDRTSDIPAQWMEDLDASGAVQKGIGGIGGVPTNVLAKVLTVPYKDLMKPSRASRFDDLLGRAPPEPGAQEPDYGARFLKAYTAAARWSQNVAFHYQERRIGAVLLHFLKTDEKLSTEQASREVSKILNDSHNLTPFERAKHPNLGGMTDWMYFYGWVRRGLRLAANTVLKEPKKIMAPLRGVQTANEEQGDEGTVGGTGLSLRSAGNALEKMTGIKGLGTDEHGNPRYVDIPSFWSFGSSLARFLGGMAHPFDDPAKVVLQRSTSNLSPLAGIAARSLITQAGSAEMPAPYNDVLWDKDAPNKAAQFFGSIAKMYAPVPVRNTATLGLGPNVFSEPNAGKVTKAQYGSLQDMRRMLIDANKAGDHDLAQQIYDQMELVANGDVGALSSARGNIARWSGVLGVKSGLRRPRYSPRF